QTFERFYPLSDMVFVRNHPGWRFAILHPGGVAFTRDSGAHWMQLPDVTRAIDRPFSGWYDQASGNRSSLYVTLHRRGIIPIEASSAPLQRVVYTLSGAPAPTGLPPAVYAVNETGQQATLLRRGNDGKYRGEHVVDLSASPMAYH